MNFIKKLFSSGNTDDEFKSKIIRKSVELKIGGQRPNDSLTSSWFGKVLLAKSAEEWPTQDGKLMKPLCQINLEELDFIPDILDGIQLITIFVTDENEIPIFDSNGDGWLLRHYSNINELIEIEIPKFHSEIKEFQMFPQSPDIDYPTWEDCPTEIPSKFEENFHEIFPNKSGFKIGGWPTLIQSSVFSGLDPSNKTEYAFQIDSVATDKANLYLGDSGVMYFGINKSGDEIIWEMTWQSM